MMDENKENDYSKISPTAKITAYWKSLSDIPYSKEIANAVKAEQTTMEMIGDRMEWSKSFSPSMFEARYKAINYGLKKNGIENVLELASGLSPRGLEIASKGGTYVGTDLLEMYNESSKVIIDIANRERVSLNNIHLQPANVLNKDELENAIKYLKGKKFAICNEGLLPYLTKNEKFKMAENIREILLNNDGCWITTDIDFKSWRKALIKFLDENMSETIKVAIKNISNQTGTDILKNDFTDKLEALKFYEDLGFEIEEYPMYAGDYVLSTISYIPDNLRERFISLLKTANAFTLTPKY
jgi:hypothetical protein